MEVKLLFIVVIVYLSLFRACTGASACHFKQDHPVVKGCVNNVVQTLAFYFDTGTGAFSENQSCECLLSPLQNRSSLLFNAGTEISDIKHTVQVKDLELNDTVTNGSVIIDSSTALWLRTDGIRGVCISVSADKNVSITCYARQNNTNDSTTDSITSTAAKLRTTTPTSAEDKPEENVINTSSPDSNGVMSGDNVNEMTGPLAGAVSGFVVLLIVVLLLVVFCKRRKRSNKSNSRQPPQGEDIDIYTTENPMYEKSDVDDNIQRISNDISHVGAKVEETRRKDKNAETEYQYVTNLDRSTGTPGATEFSDLPEYSLVDKRSKRQENRTAKKTVSNLYDHTDGEERVTCSDDYHHLGTFSDRQEDYDRTGKSTSKQKYNQNRYDTSSH